MPTANSLLQQQRDEKLKKEGVAFPEALHEQLTGLAQDYGFGAICAALANIASVQIQQAKLYSGTRDGVEAAARFQIERAGIANYLAVCAGTGLRGDAEQERMFPAHRFKTE